VATSGDFDDLSNKPTVPTSNDELTNGAGYITGAALSSYPLTSSLATVATSGDFDDLLNKPVVPTNNNQLINGSMALVT
jgi:hypothetical protein